MAGKAFISVTALYDEVFTFYGQGGKLFDIALTSLYLGTVQLPATLTQQPNTNGIQKTTCLKVKTEAYGVLYLNITLEEYYAKIAEAQAIPDVDYPEITETVTITGDTDEVHSTAWAGATFTNIVVDGIVSDIRTISFFEDSGIMFVHFDSGLVTGQWVQLTYHLGE